MAKKPKKPATASRELDGRTKIKRLQQRVRELERNLASVQAECSKYRDLVHLWLAAQHTPEELRRFAMDDDETSCQPLEQFFGELEAIVKKKGA